MVFVSRATPTFAGPIGIFISTDEASTSIEMSGPLFSFTLPGHRLTALHVQPILDSNIVGPVPISPIVVIVEVEGYGRCHIYDRDRWFNRRITNVLITEYSYELERLREEAEW